MSIENTEANKETNQKKERNELIKGEGASEEWHTKNKPWKIKKENDQHEAYQTNRWTKQ